MEPMELAEERAEAITAKERARIKAILTERLARENREMESPGIRGFISAGCVGLLECLLREIEPC